MLFIILTICVLSIRAQNYQSSLVKELPGGPENAPSVLEVGNEKEYLVLHYNNATILAARFDNEAEITSTVQGAQVIEQRIQFRFEKETTVHALVYGSSEALAAETRGEAQDKLALVRTSHGLSNNLRNNAIYDRNFDWMLELPEGTVIKSSRKPNGTTQFELTFTVKNAELVFRPRYYQKHKNLPYFQPWTYQVYKESITGWCSWWAYFREFTEEDHLDLLEMWQKKHLADYGYRFIQIDDVYQGENDRGRENCEVASGYLGGRPTTWLDWKKDLFPSGLTGYVTSIHQAGFDPAIWMGCFFSDEETVQKHPEWFVHDELGNPAAAPWVSYVMDATNPEVVEALIRPTFKGMKNAGIGYVKIDQLRHYLYDNLHNNLEWCSERGVGPDELLRAYLRVAREELGDDTFILSCWGVLPESIGLADACRIGGDGYGPVTLQQYNSWNGIVWRNDPDHCDVSPNKKGKDIGNVKELEARQAMERETIIRPALASIAGAILMLSDKPEVYEDDSRIYGLRRSSPVLFSVPGQLYDFDSGKTNWLKSNERTDITTGRHPSPIDGDQFGEVCPYWLNEFNTGFENWNVLHRLNWSERNQKSLEPVVLKFADLGLDSSKEYLVYEFWSDKMYGVLEDDFALGELEPYGLESLAIREKLDRPQLVSTNRHLSQGAAEIEKLLWEENSLKGRSRVVGEDEYVITIYIPEDYLLHAAIINGEEAGIEQKGEVLKISYRPAETSSVQWEVSFKRK
ncbi:alpha-galactosidase [Sunxiuqinia sp. sy24]|uniref:alpha-galactosidase n=1 Tax=Sunxiuqinia sp. sy24 TaxID=3461495 RepID=UPI0040454212